MKYVVAVSGGIDSCVLLHSLVNDDGFATRPANFSLDRLVVAHFEHGIRGADSAADARFVAALAKLYGCAFVMAEGNLSAKASESVARTARWRFLASLAGKQTQQASKAEAAVVVTAHHADDKLETMIINLSRGTGWRGLASLSPTVLRPLLARRKTDIYNYALRYRLEWVEDASNQTTIYLRNRLRRQLALSAKRSTQQRVALLRLGSSVQALRSLIEAELSASTKSWRLADGSYLLPRYQLIMYPPEVSRELLYDILRQLNPAWHPTTSQLLRCYHFVRLARPGRNLRLVSGLSLTAQTEAVSVQLAS